MEEDERNEVPEHTVRRKTSYKGLVVFVVLVIGWFLLRAYAQSGVNAYNECYKRAVAATDRAQQATVAAGYSQSEAVKSSFDIYEDQANNCTEQVPPSWVVLITGVRAKN